MTRKTGPLLLSSALFAVLACASLGKPADMTAYEQAQAANTHDIIAKRYPELAKHAEDHYRQAVAQREEKEAALVDHHAKVSMLWWQAAVARSHGDDLAAQTVTLREELGRTQKTVTDARKQEKLALSALERAKQVIALQGKVADSEGNNTARDAINGALRALKEAEAVDAGTHAKQKFTEAESKLAAATSALSAGKADKAKTLAAEAETAAASAKAEAAPLFSSTQADQERTAGQRKLFDSLNAIDGVTAAIVEGGVMVTILDSFDNNGIDIKAAMQGVYGRIADVAKAHAGLSLVIEGHTDSKGRAPQNLQLSDTRAKSVMAYLASKGVEPGRMTALGKGSEKPVANNKTNEGRARNRRIEILFSTPGV